MSYYAKIESNIVTQAIVADADFIAAQSGTWVEYRSDGSIRANAAGIGYTYDSSNDVFYAPKPYASWSLDSDYEWQPPVAPPSDWSNTKDYEWNESIRQSREVS